MISFLKKNWDILSGLLTGLIITVASKFDLYVIQLVYSIFILLLVSIGLARIMKQAVDKMDGKSSKRKKRQHNLIDDMVDSQTSIKAINLANKPTREGEKLGNLILDIVKRGKKNMSKFKKFWEKARGYILAGALAILSIIEMCGGFINEAFDSVLTVNGVELLPIITMVLSVVVASISNGFDAEQMQKIKALFSKKTTNELVVAEIKRTIKEDEAKLKEFNKTLATKEAELENLETHLKSARNTHEAKKEMYSMTPRLATADDVQLAANEVVNIEAQIVEKTNEINAISNSINNLTTTVNALKAQL